MGLIESLVIAAVVGALVWWLLANVIGPLLVESHAPFLTTLGNAFIRGSILLGFVAALMSFFGGWSFFGFGGHH